MQCDFLLIQFYNPTDQNSLRRISFPTYMSRLLVQERDKRANTYACISLKSFNVSFHKLCI